MFAKITKIMQEMPFEIIEDMGDGLKRLTKLIGLAAMATLLQGCPERNPNETIIQSLTPKQAGADADIESIRGKCVGDSVSSGGLIKCQDEMGVVTSLGD